MDDLHRIIEVLKERNVCPDFLITSPAVRAVQTAVLLSQGLAMPPDSIAIKNVLYPGTSEQYLDCIKELSKEQQSVMIVGHHPAMTDTINTLLKEELQRVATSSVHAIQWDKAKSWEKCLSSPSQLVFAIKPKNI